MSMQEEEETANAAVKGAKQAAGKKSRKPKKSAKTATRTAASSHADNAQEAAAAEQPANQHAAPCDDALHNPQLLSQPNADIGVQAPSHAEDQADDSWQLCPLSKVCHAMLQTSRMCQIDDAVVNYIVHICLLGICTPAC